MNTPNQGDRYIPYRKFVGPLIPSIILRRKDLHPIAKLVFGRLAQYAGENGDCFVSYQTLANELGISRKTAIRNAKLLAEKGYIEIEARTKEGKAESDTNLFHFLWHECMTEARDTELLGVGSERNHPSDKLTPPVVTNSHHPRDTMTPQVGSERNPKRTTVREPRKENHQETIEEGLPQTQNGWGDGYVPRTRERDSAKASELLGKRRLSRGSHQKDYSIPGAQTFQV